MSLSIEQIRFVERQTIIERNLLDSVPVETAKQKLRLMYAQLPLELQHPVKDFEAMDNLRDLSDFRDLTLIICNPPGICWPVSLIPPLVTTQQILPEDQANDLLEKMQQRNPAFLSFQHRVQNTGTWNSCL